MDCGVVASRGTRATYWLICTIVLAIIGVLCIAVGLRLDGGDRLGVVALGVASLAVCLVVAVLWRRHKL
jgi:hypothetical protein